MKCVRTILLLIVLPVSGQVLALYEWTDEASQGDARLLLRAFVVASQHGGDDEQAAGALARIIVQSTYGSKLSYEFNAYQTYFDNSLVGQQSKLGTTLDVERSAALQWSLSDTEYAQLAIDRANIRFSGEQYNLTLGRQAINLATTFFFSPNDFFAPFSAQTFYRVYKPGVDAIRAELAIGELSTLTLIDVLGYTQQTDSDSGWSNDPDSRRNSWLVRYVTNLAGFEWGLITGKVKREQILGASASGDLFDWLGIRIEGHQAEDRDNQTASYTNYSIGLEHRWENSLTLQFEQYYHGRGAMQVDLYDLRQAYPARRYQALGLNYEFSPLLTGQFSLIRNQIDSSRIYSMNTVYSVTNESDLSIGLSIPDGKQADGKMIRSEFGNYPNVLNVELRAYF